MVSSHVVIYEKLYTYLNKELFKYSNDELKMLILQMNLNVTHSSEFAYFLEYCNQNYPNAPLPSTKFQKNKSNKMKNESYTKEQWESFQLLVFGSIDNIEYLNKALKSRTIAIVWCYFVLHFVTAWRSCDMYDLPFPKLILIGFENGRAFIDYMKQNGEFTATMGEIICNDISRRMKLTGETANKQEGLLRFIVGESMVRQVGLLLALCEAHRELIIAKGHDSTRIITCSAIHVRNDLKLFGDEYKKIFGDNTFSNLAASRTTTKKISEEGGSQGTWLAAVARAHKGLPGLPSSTTADIYITHAYRNNKDKSLDVISFNLFERGVFSSIPYMLLQTIDNRFYKIDYQEQTKMVQKLGLAPYEVESCEW